jgi:Lon protease-like protein
VTEIGLFPLPLVLVPTERIPLHIFEERYRELITECIESGEAFGLVLATGDGAVHEVGTKATVEQVLEVLDDDAVNIVVEGGERFRLLELTSGRSFTTCEIEPVVDDDDPPTPEEAASAYELFQQLAEATGSDVDLPSPDAAQLDFELAARIDFGVEAKQELLAETSPRKRMQRLGELLQAAIETTALQHTLRERAGRNGKVSPLGPDHSEP